MYDREMLLAAYKARSAHYSNTGVYENRFPGSIGFVTESTEIFVEKENLYNRLNRPHFYLYNHETDEIQQFRFDEIERCDPHLLDFLNTVRYYSTDSSRWPLIRTYYDDLISEWEIVNKCYFRRKFMCK